MIYDTIFGKNIYYLKCFVPEVYSKIIKVKFLLLYLRLTSIHYLENHEGKGVITLPILMMV